jgi:tetratricopeptide (TPR) repeat protein
MSADTTLSESRMDCTLAAREEILERYVAGDLAEKDRDAFEEHCFGCDRCFDELQTLQAIRDELPRLTAEVEPGRRRTLPVWVPTAVAATLILAVGGAIWLRHVPTVVSETTRIGPPPVSTPPRVPQPASPAVPPAAPVPSLEELARFEPPVYRPSTLRGVPDEATARFLRGMEAYRKADYKEAVADLRLAASADPDAPHVRFFLGIGHLMLSQGDLGIDRLRGTIALGGSPYLEDAHFYLAKALLSRNDLAGAEAELKRVVQLRGQRGDEARHLLSQVRRLK